jgi:hypothetical protein
MHNLINLDILFRYIYKTEVDSLFTVVSKLSDLYKK